MIKEKLGTKRLCGNCGKKFYDLSRDPIICPACVTVFVVEKPKPRAEPKPAPAEETVAAAAAPEPALEEKAKPAIPEPEFVSLDDAAAEEEIEDDADLIDLGDDEEEIPPDDNEDVFLEEVEDEAGSDVSGIIGSPIDPKDEA